MEIVDIVPPELKNNVIVTSVDALFKWGRANSIWPLSSGLACCSIEMMCAAAARFAKMSAFCPRPRWRIA